jgi:hypothetical protein
LGSKTTLFWASKRRRFDHFIIIFLKKKKKKRKKKKENIKKKRKEKRKRKILKKKGLKEIGGGWSHPTTGLGVVEPPPWPRGWPKVVAESTPRSLGVVRPPPKSQNPFFLFFFFLGFWGWPDHPLGHGGGSTTPRPAVGVAPATPWPKMGWPGWSHPRFLSTPFFFFLIFSFFFFLFFFFFYKNDKMV